MTLSSYPEPKPWSRCLSTHGGAGFAPYSYWDGDEIVCGACGVRINPAHVFGVPFWITGARGKPWEGEPPSALNSRMWNTYNPETRGGTQAI